jgi:hypothetical protein
VLGLLAGAFPASKSGLAAWTAYLLTLALHAAVQQQPGYYAASRGWLVLVFKLLLGAVLMCLVVTCVLEPIHSPGSYVKVLLMGSGIVMLNCTGGQPGTQGYYYSACSTVQASNARHMIQL